MIQETKPAEDHQNHVLESGSENPKQGQEGNIGKLKSRTSLHHDESYLSMTFLEDLDKDIGRKFSNACESQVQPINAGERLENNSNDQQSNKDGNELYHNNSLRPREQSESNEKRIACKPVSAQPNITKISAQSNVSQKPCAKQVSTSKIPKPVRSQKSNVLIQQPGSKATSSCRTVPVSDRTSTQYKRQRQSSVGPGGSAGIIKHPLNAPKDGKRNENDVESHRSRIKPSQSSPIRKYEALDVILPAKKGGGETTARSENGETEMLLRDFENNENKAQAESRNEYLIWLSKAISDKMLNICKLEECFSNYKSTFAIDKEPLATEELEILHKLIKKVSDLYEQCQSQNIENNKLQASFQLAHDSELKKIALLETENQDLIYNMENLSKKLEEEKTNSDKMKRGSQTIPAMKKKIRDVELKFKFWEDKQREQVQKLKNLETNCKLKNMDSIEKEVKDITSVCEKLMQENDNLRKELQKNKDQQNLKLSKLIVDSEEMKEMQEQLSTLRCRYNDELNKGKKYLAEQQQTSMKLKEMEMKSKNLSQLIEEAKKEIKAKNYEFEEFKKTVESDKQMMKTELDACKVTKQGAIDENAMLRAKIESLQNKNDRVHSLEKDNIEIEHQLRTDLGLRDEQIMQLQEQIKRLLMERKQSKDRMKGGKMPPDQCQISYQERGNLAAQILDLQKNVDELANNNLELQKLLSDRNAELEQRDQIVKLQTDVLKIRDELIELLRNKDSKHEKHVEELSSILMEREHAIEKEWKKKVDKLQERHSNVTSNQTKSLASDPSLKEGSEEEKLSLKDLHLLFQNKECDLDSMQVRIKTLEKIHQTFHQQRIRQETRMRTLEETLQEKSSRTWIPVLVK